MFGTRQAAPGPGHLLHPHTDDRLCGPCRGSWCSGQGGSPSGRVTNPSPQALSSTPGHSGMTLKIEAIRILCRLTSPWALPCIHAQHSAPQEEVSMPPAPSPPAGGAHPCWPPQGHWSNRSFLHHQRFGPSVGHMYGHTQHTAHTQARTGGCPHLKGACSCVST